MNPQNRKRIFRNWLMERGGWLLIAVSIFVLCFPALGALSEEKFGYKLHHLIKAVVDGGVFQSLIAGVLLSLYAYSFRDIIRSLIVSRVLTIHMPMMFAVSPILIAKQDMLWEEHGLKVDIEFRYAGRSGLSILDEDHIAVASDVAICSYRTEMNCDGRSRVRVMPFVCIQDNLRILVRDVPGMPRIDSIRDLQNKKIGYYKNSVHEHYLERVLKNIPWVEFPATSVLECYSALVSGEIDACALWEPHYLAITNRDPIVRELDDGLVDSSGVHSYTWFLCLVATESCLNKHPLLENQLLRIMTLASDRTQIQKPEAILACHRFINTDFTGMTSEDLKVLLAFDRHTFGVRSNVKGFASRLEELMGSSFGSGAADLMRSMWRGLEDHIGNTSVP